MNNSYAKYEKMQKPLVVATTAFSEEDIDKINLLATKIPVFMTGNFSVAFHENLFLMEQLKFS